MNVSDAVASVIKGSYEELGAGGSANRFPAVSTRSGSFKPDDAEAQQIAKDLVARAKAMADSNGKTIDGYVTYEVESSDSADCVGPGGETVRTFQENQLCYRLKITWSV